MTIATTRKRYSWCDLTPRSAADTGDIVDVWYDDQPWRGVYLGPGFAPSGCACEEIMLDDQTSLFCDSAKPYSLRLVSKSQPWSPEVLYERVPSEDELDERDPLPLLLREKWAIAILITLELVAVVAVVAAYFIWWR